MESRIVARSWTGMACAACCLATSAALGDLVFDDAFDNGNLDSATFNGAVWTVAPSNWLHFRLTGAEGATPLFRVDKAEYFYRDAHRMVYRYGGTDQWLHFDNGHVDGDWYYFDNDDPFTADVVYIAYWHPWTWGQMQASVAQMSGEAFVRDLGARVDTPEGRPVYGFEVTDPAVADEHKMHVAIISRQHQYESLGSHISRGMSDWLIHSDDPEAVRLRRVSIMLFYPMVMPDDVFHGRVVHQGTDPNRSWAPNAPPVGEPSGTIEVDALRTDIMERAGGHLDYGIDIHSHGGHIGEYYWWGVKSGPPEIVAAAAYLVQRIHHHDAADHGGEAAIASTIAQDVLSFPCWCADYWMYETMGAAGFTLEPGSVPVRTRQRIEEVGVSIAKGLNDAIPSRIPGDVDGDSFIDVEDLLLLLAAWGEPGGPADLNADGIVDVEDLLLLLAAWDPAP